MKPLFKLSVGNPVLVHMITIAVIVFGTYTFVTMPRELNPDLSFNWAFIVVVYPGVSPEEIEKLITKPIEDEIADVGDIESITSVSAEGRNMISIKFDQDLSADEFDKRYQDLRTELDKVSDLPEDAEDPWMFKLNTSTWMSIVHVVLAGDLPEKEMRQLAEELEDDIESIEQVSQISLAGVRDREIWVACDPAKLDRYPVALSQVVQALAAKNLNVPGGELKIGRSQYLLRTIGEFGSVDEIGSVIVRHLLEGGKIRVRDVASVKDTYEDREIISRLDGKPSITLSVSKRPEGNTITIIDEIRDLVDKYRRERLPEDVQISLVTDTSIYIRNSLGKLARNAGLGVILVLVVLYLFIGLRNAIFVAIGIPISLLVTFAFMEIKGESINSNSLFGLVLVLGIIVDDAIIVMENVYRRMQRGESPGQASVNGAYEVAWPVITASLTTMAAFLPLALLPGIVGKFMRIIPIVVSLTIVASLIECFFILPSHIADWGKVDQSGAHHRLMRNLLRPYTRLLSRALRYRYLVLVGIFLCLVLSVALVPLVGVDLFADDDWPMFSVYVTMPPGTRLETTDEVARKFEKAALTLPKPEINAVITRTGIVETDTGVSRDSNLAMLTLDLVDAKHRDRTVDEILADLRDRCRLISGPEQVEFKKVSSGPPTGGDVEVMVKGKYFSELEVIADEIKAQLAKTPGVTDISDNYLLGKEEMKLYIDEDKAHEYALTVQQIAFAVRNAFEGTKATVMRDGDEEIDVVVKFDASARTGIADVMNMKLVGATGDLIPLKDVARISLERGYAEIHRFKGERAITITANVDSGVTQPVKVNQMIQEHFAQISPRYPGYSLDFEGEFAEFNRAFSGILQLFAIGVLLIYFILGSQFKSFIQPLIIIMTVPFAFIGAMLGLITSGNPLSIASMYGLVALAGIVVNDSIVLIAFINRQRAAGVRKWRAIISGGRMRLRPILLTSITTISGLLPMALGIGGKSALWMPMAGTIVWGLAVATVLTLFVIPAFYAIIDDISRWRGVRVEAHKVVPAESRGGELEWIPEVGSDD